MSGALSQDFTTASPPKLSPPMIRRELVCPQPPKRPVAFTPKIGDTGKASFPTTCTWKRLGLKQIRQDIEAELRQKMQKTKHHPNEMSNT